MNTTVAFFNPVQDELRAVEDMIRTQADGYHPDLKVALDLIIDSGGKRIRPALTMLVGKMYGADPDILLYMAAAVELLHTATLVHDDLIDGALLRRGSPTLNSHWSPGATVLTGDFLFAQAAKLAAETNSVPVIQLFAKTLTIIVNGEINQLLGSRCKADRENYQKRIYAKTASLFETSARSAAMISLMDEETVESMRCFGHDVGMAFQIVDDILDYTSDQAVMGKPVGSDLRQGIVTLPAVIYTERYQKDEHARALLAGRCLEEDEIDDLVERIRKSDIIHRSHQEAVAFVESALSSLRQCARGPQQYALEELANYIVERKF